MLNENEKLIIQKNCYDSATENNIYYHYHY